MMMFPGKKKGERKEGRGREEGRTEMVSLGSKNQGSSAGEKEPSNRNCLFPSLCHQIPEFARNPTVPMPLCRPLPPGNWVQTKLDTDVHNPPETRALRMKIIILLVLWLKRLTYLSKSLPKHCCQSHFLLTAILRMRNYQSGFLLMRKA